MTTARTKSPSVRGSAPPSTLPWTAAAACVAVASVARAGEPDAPARLVVQYDAPPECPGAESLAASVRADLAGRRWDQAHPLQVRVTVSRGPWGYEAVIASSTEDDGDLERTATSPTCDEVVDVAAEIVALAQSERFPAVLVVRQAPGPAGPPLEEPSHPAPARGRLGDFTYSFTLGYGAFTAGPADPVVFGPGEKTTFNPAQGVRLGFDVTHAAGWWKHSLHVGAAYYRQSTTTVQQVPVTYLGTPAQVATINDRDVLLGTIDACPINLDYAFVSLIPCATFSMIQTNGNSGTDPQLETGLGGSAYLRAGWRQFFAEGVGTIVAASDTYEPPSRPFRIFYSVSLGITVQ